MIQPIRIHKSEFNGEGKFCIGLLLGFDLKRKSLVFLESSVVTELATQLCAHTVSEDCQQMAWVVLELETTSQEE